MKYLSNLKVLLLLNIMPKTSLVMLPMVTAILTLPNLNKETLTEM